MTDDEISEFVKRQLVTTDQANKAVCDVLKQLDSESKIVYSKATLVSDFRHLFNLLKSRDINDFHHAHDAYLNIVVGNIYNSKFSDGNRKRIEEMRAAKENDEKGSSIKSSVDYIFKHDQYVNYHYQDDNYLLWKKSNYIEQPIEGTNKTREIEDLNNQGTIKRIRKYLSYNDVLVTHMLFSNKGNHGLFDKIGIATASSGQASFPLKQGKQYSELAKGYNKDGFASKYGGYNSFSYPYAMLVKSIVKKGKWKYTLESIPEIYLRAFNDKSDIINYLTNSEKLKLPEVILNKVLIGTIIEIPGEENSVCVRTSAVDGVVNDNQLVLPNEYKTIYCKIEKMVDSKNKDRLYGKDSNIYLNEKLFITDDEANAFCKYMLEKVYNNEKYLLLPTLGTSFKKLVTNSDAFYNKFTKLKLNKDKLVIISRLVRLTQCKSVQGTDITMINPDDSKLSIGQIKMPTSLVPNVRIIQTSKTGLLEKILFIVPEE